jgi:hypothetical protein
VRMPWLKYIMKVRLQDPSCVARYTHMDALCWYVQCLRREENPGGRIGYPKNHWDSFFVRSKCGKRMGLTGLPNSNPRGLNLK